MKKSLLNFIMSFLITFIPMLLLVLIFTFLNYQQIIEYKLTMIIIYTLSSLFYFFFTLLLSKKEKSHGFIRGLIITSVYILLFLIIVQEKNILNSLFLIIKSVALMLGSILGVNLVKEN